MGSVRSERWLPRCRRARRMRGATNANSIWAVGRVSAPHSHSAKPGRSTDGTQRSAGRPQNFPQNRRGNGYPMVSDGDRDIVHWKAQTDRTGHRGTRLFGLTRRKPGVRVPNAHPVKTPVVPDRRRDRLDVTRSRSVKSPWSLAGDSSRVVMQHVRRNGTLSQGDGLKGFP